MLWKQCSRTSSALRRVSGETSLLHLPSEETSRASSNSTLVSLMFLIDLWTRMIGCVRCQGCSRLLMFLSRSGSSVLLDGDTPTGVYSAGRFRLAQGLASGPA